MAAYETDFRIRAAKMNRLLISFLILLWCVPLARAHAHSLPSPASGPPALATSDPRSPLVFTPAPDSYVELDGTAAFVGSWYSRSAHVRGTVILATPRAKLQALFDPRPTVARSVAKDRSTPRLSLPLAGPPVGNLSIPVLSLSGNSPGMNHDMDAALKARRHPMIQYVFEKLSKANIRWSHSTGRPILQLSVLGKLTIAGKNRTLTTRMLVWREAQGHFHVQAHTAILMSSFHITPPSAFFGLIRANDRVSVIFNLDFVLTRHSLKRPTRP